MGNKMKKLICSLLTAAMLITSAGAVSFAAEGDQTPAATAEPAVTETTGTENADDASTADQTDDEKEANDTEVNVDAANNSNDGADASVTDTSEADAGSYENDAYYEKSLALCSSLGIISGYEDGSVRPESKVTRAEMASIVLRMLAYPDTAVYQNVFSDVESSHWAATQIQSAYEANVISGMGDGTFQPDSEVTYAQVIVMLVNAMNYQDDAEYYGGWKDGYIKIAREMNLLVDAPGSADVASDRGVVIKMVYNALLGDYKSIRYFDEFGKPRHRVDEEHPTLAYNKFNVKDERGLVLGTAKTSISDSPELDDDQVEIMEEKTKVQAMYNTILTGLEDYIGQRVRYYYKDNEGINRQLLAVTYDASRSEVYTFDDVDDIKKVEGFEINNGSITPNKGKVRLCTPDVKIIYNGKMLTDAQIAEIKANGENLNDYFMPEQGSLKLVNTDKTVNEGYDVVFIDSYETAVVSSATDTKLIASIQDPDPAAQVGDQKKKTWNLDDTVNRKITVTKGGTEAKVRNLKKNDVVVVKASYDNTVVDIICTGESVTGKATSVLQEKDRSYVVVNGDRYDVANVAAGKIKSGEQGTYYLDKFGQVGYVDSEGGSARLSSGEKYGWIMGGYKRDGGDFVVKLMTEDGAKEYKLAANVDYWAPCEMSSRGTLSKTNAEAAIQQLFVSDSRSASYGDIIDSMFLSSWGRNDVTGKTVGRETRNTYIAKGLTKESTWRLTYMTQGTPFALVKFKANSNDALTKFYCATSTTNYGYGEYDHDYAVANWSNATWQSAYEELAGDNEFGSLQDFKDCLGWAIQPGQIDSDYKSAYPNITQADIIGVKQPYYSAKEREDLVNTDALIIDLSNKNGATLVGGLVGGYIITDGIPEFKVPNTSGKFDDAAAYTVGKVSASAYNQRENGLSDDFYIADADGTSPGAIVRMIADSTKPVDPADIDTAGNLSAMVVDTIDRAVDDDENAVYQINGYLAGNEVHVTTTKTSALGEMVGYNGTRDYALSKDEDGNSIILWDADNDSDTNKLTDHIHKGDIILTDGNHILIIESAQAIYNQLAAGGSPSEISKVIESSSNTRTKHWFGLITDTDNDEYMKIGGNSISPDASLPMDIVEIDMSRGVSGAISISDDLATVSDVVKYGEDPDEYDYAYARIAGKGALGEVIIYRIKNASSISTAR